jgi:hypothetical protein
MTTTAADQAQGAASQVKGQAQQAAGQAKEQATQVAGKAKGRAAAQIDQRSTQAGEQVTSTAQDARSVAEQLRSQGKDKPAQLAETVADRIEQVGNYLKNGDSDQFLSDLERIGRKQPMAITLGGFVLGFAASRFLKASSSQRYQSSPDYRPPSQTGRDYRSGSQFPPATTQPADFSSRAIPSTTTPATGEVAGTAPIPNTAVAGDEAEATLAAGVVPRTPERGF